MEPNRFKVGVVVLCIGFVVIVLCKDFLDRHPDLTPEEARQRMVENWGPEANNLQKGDLIVIRGKVGDENTYLLLSITPESLRAQRIFATYPVSWRSDQFRDSGLKITLAVRQDQHDEYKELLLQSVAEKMKLE